MEEGNQYKSRGHEAELLYQIKTEERKAGRCISLSFIQGHIYTRRGGVIPIYRPYEYMSSILFQFTFSTKCCSFLD